MENFLLGIIIIELLLIIWYLYKIPIKEKVFEGLEKLMPKLEGSSQFFEPISDEEKINNIFKNE